MKVFLKVDVPDKKGPRFPLSRIRPREVIVTEQIFYAILHHPYVHTKTFQFFIYCFRSRGQNRSIIKASQPNSLGK